MPTGPLCCPTREARRAGENRPTFQETAEILGKLLGGRKSLVRELGNRLEHNRLEIDRNQPIPIAKRFAAEARAVDEQLRIDGVTCWMMKRRQLIQRNTERINVCAVVDQGRSAQRLFGTHIARRTQNI